MMEEVLGIVRTFAGIGAGALATHGYIDGSDQQVVVGAVVAVATAIWSIWNKRRQKATVQVALMTPPPDQPK